MKDSDAAVQHALKELGSDAPPGKIARAIRQYLKLSLKEVAERIGHDVHFTTIAKLETGKMQFTYDWAHLISPVFGVPVNIFHMPYEALHTAKRVPVYVGMTSALYRNEVAPDHYTAFLTTKDNLFGIFTIGSPDIVSEHVLITLIVDPDKHELRHDSVYAVFDDDTPDGIIGIFRDDGSRRIVSWPVQQRNVLLLNDRQPIVLGEVISVDRMLVSRNR